MTTQRSAYRASILHSIADPKEVELEQSYQYFEDGVLVVENGHVIDIGPATEVLARHSPSMPVTSYQNKLITLRLY